MGGGVFATLGAGIVIGLAVTNGSADDQSPTVQTTETTVVQLTSTSVVVAPVPAVETTPVSVEAPTPSAPIVEAVPTTPEAVAPAPVQPAEPTRVADNPAPQVGQGEGVIEGSSVPFDSTRGPEPITPVTITPNADVTPAS